MQPSLRPLITLFVSNVLGGVGVASGIAVGSLLVVSMSSTEFAGIGQALSVLGAGMLAVPLARLATRRGRRIALASGYAVATVGALVVLIAAAISSLPLLLLGLVAFGAAQATNLQTRYAASELASRERRGRVMSTVMWATTLGSVTGPNLSAAGGVLGESIGLPRLAGPYLFSLAGFILAGLVVFLLFHRGAPPADLAPSSRSAVSARAALGWAARHRDARFAVALTVAAHAVMVGIMSMTPVHLGQLGFGLGTIGLTISLHILGMYALSPVFGWIADRIGPRKTALLGLIIITASACLAFVAPRNLPTVITALTLLGLGWSASIIASSVLLGSVDSGEVRVPLQGATDALMSYGGAAAALLAGVLLAALGFGGLAVVMLLVLIPAAVTGWIARPMARASHPA